MSRKILWKLVFSTWLSLAFGLSQIDKMSKTNTKIQSQEKEIQSLRNMIKNLETQIQDMMNRMGRFHAKVSCSALLKEYPFLTNGTYYINPQGLSSSPFVQVYCDMTSKNGVGVTMIGHDSESRTLVDGYEGKGSYKRKITYDISMDQVVAIMKQSKKCEQFIKYQCYHSFLLGYSYGWWVSRQGSKMNYWGGADVDSRKCACGKTNSCVDVNEKCNCNENDATWREDSGYLTDKNTLPVTELRFGDTGTRPKGIDEKGYHTLGKLRCWN